jgi:hypothetical protein
VPAGLDGLAKRVAHSRTACASLTLGPFNSLSLIVLGFFVVVVIFRSLNKADVGDFLANL